LVVEEEGRACDEVLGASQRQALDGAQRLEGHSVFPARKASRLKSEPVEEKTRNPDINTPLIHHDWIRDGRDVSSL